MRRVLISTLAVAGLLLAQGTPAPFGPPPPDGQPRAARFDGLKQALGLTDDQLEQLRNVRVQLREQLQPKFEQLRQLRQQLGDSIGNSAVTDAELGALVRQINQLEAEIRQTHEAADAQAVALVQGWGLGAKLAELQKAAELIPAVGQARALGLISPPDRDAQGPQAGPGPGLQMFHGMRFGRR